MSNSQETIQPTHKDINELESNLAQEIYNARILRELYAIDTFNTNSKEGYKSSLNLCRTKLGLMILYNEKQQILDRFGITRNKEYAWCCFLDPELRYWLNINKDNWKDFVDNNNVPIIIKDFKDSDVFEETTEAPIIQQPTETPEPTEQPSTQIIVHVGRQAFHSDIDSGEELSFYAFLLPNTPEQLAENLANILPFPNNTNQWHGTPATHVDNELSPTGIEVKRSSDIRQIFSLAVDGTFTFIADNWHDMLLSNPYVYCEFY